MPHISILRCGFPPRYSIAAQTASPAIAAVSARRILGPSVTCLHPLSLNSTISSAVHPPSGPIARATLSTSLPSAAFKECSCSVSASSNFFSALTISNANFNAAAVLYGQGLEYSSGNVSGYDSQIDRVSGNGAGTLTINQNYDDNDGTYSAGNENGATLAVTFDSANPGRATFPPGSDSAFFMFFDNNSAFYLDLNSGGSPNYLETGWLLPQTQTTFTNAALAGTYVLANLQLKPGDNSAGEIDLSSAGSIAANLSTGGQGSFSFDQPMNDLTYSWLTQTYGAFSILESGQSGGETCVVITPSSAVCMDGSGGSAKMSILQQ